MRSTKTAKDLRMKLEPWVDEGLVQRMHALIDMRGPTECWPWVGSGIKGRGRIRWMGQMHIVPRLMKAVAERQEPPEDLCACHFCDNPACCNPAHIYWATSADNIRHASASGLLRGPSPHATCRKGHPLTPDNRLPRAGASGRGCKICRRERFTKWQREHRAKRRAHRPTLPA